MMRAFFFCISIATVTAFHSIIKKSVGTSPNSIIMSSHSQKISAIVAAATLFLGSQKSFAQDEIPKVPLVTQRTANTQAYSDVGRGFKMLVS
jgi:hypothetical protein